MTLLSLAGAALWGTSPAGAQELLLSPNVDYSKPNYANTGPIRKFVDTLPGLSGVIGSTNTAGQYIPIAVANTPYGTLPSNYDGSDYYEIGLVEYTERMHIDLPATGTKLRGYVQIVPSTYPGAIMLNPAFAGCTMDVKNGAGVQMYGLSRPHYLGPLILATKNRAVRLKFMNLLPTGTNGNLFIPVDTSTIMGAGDGWNQIGTDPLTGLPTYEKYTQNRATIHLHGGLPPWVSDGTAHQWITPAGEATTYKKGAGAVDFSDMAFNQDGVMSFYWPNEMSGRLLWFHDHAYGITGPNVYAGEAQAYLLVDPTEETSLADAGVPGVIAAGGTGSSATNDFAHLIPLVIQDKTFVYGGQLTNATATVTTNVSGAVTSINVVTAGWGYVVPPTVTITDTNGTGATAGTVSLNPNRGIASIAVGAGGSGYSAQTVVTITASVGTGAVDPNWFTDVKFGMTGLPPGDGNLWYPHVYIPNQWPGNPDGSGSNPLGRWDWGPWFWPVWPLAPGVVPPTVSHTPESFMDTMMVNGQPYPHLDVAPGKYRFRILNACNDRFVNLQLYKATPGIITNIVMTVVGSGYDPLAPPLVTISGGGGRGGTATAIVDPVTTAITVQVDIVGSGYTAPPTVAIDPPLSGTPATATAQIYTLPTEVGMVPASPFAGINFPAAWRAQTIPYTPDILDGRMGGVPDPTNRGPAFVQIGTEGGLLPGPVVLPNTPVGFEQNKKNIVVLNVKEKTLFLAPAERADVVVDFSAFAGQTVLLYNDSGAPVPAADARYDYFTGNPDYTGAGGAPSTAAGMGPNTRTIMAFVVSGTKGVTTPDYYDPTLLTSLNATLPGLFNNGQYGQPAPVVPQAAYNGTYPSEGVRTNVYSHIQDTSLSFVPYGSSTPITMHMQPKTIQELFDDVGRLNATLGVELPFTTAKIQTTVPLNFVDPTTETFNDGETQIWKITHNGVDSHGVHFHLFNVQLVNRVGWDGQVTLPDPNERGWKDTVRMNPLEDIIVAMRAVKPTLPFGLTVPKSMRLLNPAMPTNSFLGFSNLDPLTGNAFVPAISNVWTDFGWEYAWHCHILGHEENDMMRPVVMNVQESAPTPGPTNLTATLLTTPTLQVNLAWVDTTANEVGFRIMRKMDSGTFAANGLVGANSTSFIDRTVATGHTYTYEVYAYNSATPSGDSPPSNQASVSTVTGQPVPTNLVATASALSTAAPTNTITFKNLSATDTGFYLQQSTNAAFLTINTNIPISPNTTVGATVTYLDGAVGLATTYYYRVQTLGSPANSAWSPIVSATTPGRLPVAPSGVRSGGATRTSILLRWYDNSNNETGFQVWRAATLNGTYTLVTTTAANATSYTVTGLTRNTPTNAGNYYFRVIALNAYGQSTAAVSTLLTTLP